MGSEKGGREHHEHKPLPEGQNTGSAISQAHWCCAVGSPYKALSKRHQALDSRSRPSIPFMKRTILSAGWKSSMDHCPMQGS